MGSGNQTPTPKSTSGNELSEKETPELKKNLANAKEGTDAKVTATKTPQKIQDGDTSEKKRED